MRKSLVVVLVLSAVLCAAAALAQGPPPPGAPGGPSGPGGPGRQAMMGSVMTALAPPPPALIERADALQLTADKKAQLQAVLTTADQTLRPLRQKAAETSQALRDAVINAQYDEQKVPQLLADAQKAETAVVNAEIQAWNQIRPILTADQLTRLKDMLGRRGGQFRGGQPRPGQGNRPPADGQPPAEAPSNAGQ